MTVEGLLTEAGTEAGTAAGRTEVHTVVEVEGCLADVVVVGEVVKGAVAAELDEMETQAVTTVGVGGAKEQAGAALVELEPSSETHEGEVDKVGATAAVVKEAGTAPCASLW